MSQRKSPLMEHPVKQIGFVGVGVMGEPMCRNLRTKSDIPVRAYDQDDRPLQRLEAHGVTIGCSIKDVAANSDVVFLSLPSGEVVSEVAHKDLLHLAQPDQIFVDLSTSAVGSTRKLGEEFAEKGATFIDAPIARTRAAAEAGTLSVMVGADPKTFGKVRPLIATFAEEITLCGPLGSGQVLKILNNLVLFHSVCVLSEVKEIGIRAGVDPRLLFDTLSKGSADSFALKSHGMKSILPENFPFRAFSVRYAHKDLKYAMALADEVGVELHGAKSIDTLFAEASEKGLGEQYWPVISQLVRKSSILPDN